MTSPTHYSLCCVAEQLAKTLFSVLAALVLMFALPCSYKPIPYSGCFRGVYISRIAFVIVTHLPRSVVAIPHVLTLMSNFMSKVAH